MNPLEFARKHLQPYKVKGPEIVPQYCPFCKGGTHRDKETFALNVDKLTYNCKRGSCGRSGTFNQLCREFGEMKYELQKSKREYKKPTVKLNPANTQIENYLKERGISKDTYQRRGISADGKGNMIFPYYDENGELAFIKYRPAREIKKGEPKMWREKDCRPILWGMDQCDTTKPLIITEGEIDALSLTEAGLPNAVSVPSGAEDMTWLDECWEWLERFDKIILFGDSDEPGKEMVRKLILKLGEERCYTVQTRYKDANELLWLFGAEVVQEAVTNAQPVPIHGLLDLSDVLPMDPGKVERMRTNIKTLDEQIGGFAMGELSVWTGKRAQGKSTFLGQMLIEAVNEGKAVCAYSGELRADMFQYWIHLQMAGKNHIKTYIDHIKEREVPYVDKETTAKLKNWYRGKFFLYDNALNSQNTEESGILKIFTYAAKRYDCKVFLVDNLMTSKFDSSNDSNYYRAQSNFVGELVNFAKTYNVHVHLVAHPKKTKEGLSNEDISGTGDITNRADNVFSLDRKSEKDIKDYDSVLTVLKNRFYGVQNKKIGLKFDQDCKRFYPPADQSLLTKVYGWGEEK